MKEQIAADFKQLINSVYPINEAEWEFLSENFTIREIKKKGLISKAGNYVNNFVFLASGTVRMYFVRNKKEYTHQIYNTQRFIVDVIAIKRNEPSAYTLEALSNCWVLEIKSEFMTNILTLSPTFEKITRLMYEDAVIDDMERVKEILSLSPLEQFQKFMKEHAALAPKLTQVKTARCLNITQETFSRYKKMSE